MSDIDWIRECVRREQKEDEILGVVRRSITALLQAAEALESAKSEFYQCEMDAYGNEVYDALSTIAKTLGKNNEES